MGHQDIHHIRTDRAKTKKQRKKTLEVSPKRRSSQAIYSISAAPSTPMAPATEPTMAVGMAPAPSDAEPVEELESASAVLDAALTWMPY